MDMQTILPNGIKPLACTLLAGLCLGLEIPASAANCTLKVTATPPAVLLPVTSVKPQHILVGAVLQDCSSTVSYTLVVASANCLLSPVGAKLRDPISKEYVRYSLEFDNPTSGGSQPVVSGLLAGACANAIGRDVNRHNIKKESSDIFIDFTGTATLAEGAYSDTLTVTLNLH